MIQRNLFLVIAIAHLNAKSSNWFSQNKASSEGNKIENLTFQFGLLQVTKETTHTLDISFLCTGLIFKSEIHLSLPSKNFLVFKTSWRRHQDVSSRNLQHVFSVSIFCLPRRLEDVLKRSCREDEKLGISKTALKTKNCYAEDVFKMSWRHVLKVSWCHFLNMSGRHILNTSWRQLLKTFLRRLADKQSVYWGICN